MWFGLPLHEGNETKVQQVFFDFSSQGHGKCQNCDIILKCDGGSSSGLLYHLRKKHQIDPTNEPTGEETPAKRVKFGTGAAAPLTIGSFFQPKETVEEKIASEATMGASYNYLAKK